MSVVQIAAIDANGKFEKDGQRSYTVRYRVRTNNRTDGPITILTYPGSPSYAASYEFFGETDQLATRQSADVALENDSDDSAKVWILSVGYSTKPVTKPDTALFSGGQGTNDPTTIVRISGNFAPYAEPLTRDVDGDPVVNAAGDPFVDLTVERASPGLVIEKTYTHGQFVTLLPNLLDDVSYGVINSTTFWYKAAKTWRLASAPWQQVYHGETKFYTVTFGFEYHREKWNAKPANRGPRYKDGTQKLRFKDDVGLDFGGDGLGQLDDDGTKRTATNPHVIYFDGAGQDSAGDPFETYELVAFGSSPYSLPTSL